MIPYSQTVEHYNTFVEEMQGQMMKAMKSMKKDEMQELYASYMRASMNKTKDEMYQEMANGMKKLNAMKMKEMMNKMSKKAETVEAEKDAKFIRLYYENKPIIKFYENYVWERKLNKQLHYSELWHRREIFKS